MVGRLIRECYYCNLIKPTYIKSELCDSCYIGLRKNPDYIPKHKRPEKKCKQCGGKYHAINLCKNCYEKTPEHKAIRKRLRAKPKNKAKIRIRNKKYHEENRDTLLLKMRERRKNLTPELKEKEKLRSKQRTVNGDYKNYHNKNKEKRNSQSKQWHLDNPDYKKNWTKSNPIKRLRIEQRYNKKHSNFYNKIQLKSWGDFIKYLFPRCIICGSTEKLEAHHIKPRAHFPELALTPDNGVTLCNKCHNEITRLLKKIYSKEYNN